MGKGRTQDSKMILNLTGKLNAWSSQLRIFFYKEVGKTAMCTYLYIYTHTYFKQRKLKQYGTVARGADVAVRISTEKLRMKVSLKTNEEMTKYSIYGTKNFSALKNFKCLLYTLC